MKFLSILLLFIIFMLILAIFICFRLIDYILGIPLSKLVFGLIDYFVGNSHFFSILYWYINFNNQFDSAIIDFINSLKYDFFFYLEPSFGYDPYQAFDVFIILFFPFALLFILVDSFMQYNPFGHNWNLIRLISYFPKWAIITFLVFLLLLITIIIFLFIYYISKRVKK